MISTEGTKIIKENLLESKKFSFNKCFYSVPGTLLNTLAEPSHLIIKIIL